MSARVFLADALDNGAGYALELGEPAILERILRSIQGDTGARLRGEPHGRACTASCPGCLRNYENRFHHWALDWRLGLDVVDLALGQELEVSQWTDRTSLLIRSFIAGYGAHLKTSQDLINGIPALVTAEGRGAAVLIGHPLWRHDEANWNPQVRRAVSELRGRGLSEVKVSDTCVLDRTPVKIFRDLAKSA